MENLFVFRAGKSCSPYNCKSFLLIILWFIVYKQLLPLLLNKSEGLILLNSHGEVTRLTCPIDTSNHSFNELTFLHREILSSAGIILQCPLFS